jgi:hypothetical protein
MAEQMAPGAWIEASRSLDGPVLEAGTGAATDDHAREHPAWPTPKVKLDDGAALIQPFWDSVTFEEKCLSRESGRPRTIGLRVAMPARRGEVAASLADCPKDGSLGPETEGSRPTIAGVRGLFEGFWLRFGRKAAIDDHASEVPALTSRCELNDGGEALVVTFPVETQAGRDGDDPDIFSWIIPHLKWGPVKNNPRNYPKSAKKGTRQAVPVYFANLTQGKVTVHKVNPAGSSRIISDALLTVPRWGEIDTRYAAKKTGPIPYDSQTVGIKRLASYVGATYLVRRVVPVEGEIDIGTYTVAKPPSGSAVCKNEPSDKCQVAEIHGHAGNHDGILDK